MDTFPLGSIVWARFGKTVWWPGMIIDDERFELPLKKGHVWIYWLSDSLVSQIRLGALEHFSKQLIRHMKPGMKDQMKNGIRRALQIFAERGQVDVSKYNDIEEWVKDPNGFLNAVKQNGALFLPSADYPLPKYVIEDLRSICRGEIPSPANGKKRKHIEKVVTVKSSRCVVQNTVKEIFQKGQYPIDDTCLGCHIKCTRANNHPLFEGFLCDGCKGILRKNLLSVDVDGCTLTCVICGELGFLAVCDKTTCCRSFCFDCIALYTSQTLADQIETSEVWNCFLCEDYHKESHGWLVPRKTIEASVVTFYQDVQMCQDLGYLTNVGKRRIRVLSLYDGIGTGKVVLDELGLDIEVYYSSEIDIGSIHIMQHNFGDEITQIGDAMALNKEKIKALCPIDLVLAGPPCNDLSIVNPRRKGFSKLFNFHYAHMRRTSIAQSVATVGSGLLLMKFFCLLRDIENICKEKTHVFWMMENTANMPQDFKADINQLLGMTPASWDAIHFTGQRRKRNFWGNLPGIYSTPDVLMCLEKEKKNLTSVLSPNHGRKAVVECTRTITSQPNSLTITNGKKNKLVTMDGEEDDLWIDELERLFGFATDYTDTGGLSENIRRQRLGKAWSVPVIKQILSPLKKYFKLKHTV